VGNWTCTSGSIDNDQILEDSDERATSDIQVGRRRVVANDAIIANT